MYVTNIADHYDNITDYTNITDNCTINENNIVIIILTLLDTILCALSFLCSMSLIVYTLIKPLFNNKCWRNFYTQIIQLVVY